MAIGPIDARLIFELRTAGKTYAQIAAELEISPSTVWKHLRGTAPPEVVKIDKKSYLRTLTAARTAALERLLDSVLSGEVTDVPKAFQTLDQAYERNHKIAVGYYLSPEQQKQWLDQLIQVINEEIADDGIKQAIAARMAALPAIAG